MQLYWYIIESSIGNDFDIDWTIWLWLEFNKFKFNSKGILCFVPSTPFLILNSRQEFFSSLILWYQRNLLLYRKFSIIWGKTHFSLFPEVPSWNRLNDRGPRTNSTGSVRSQSPLLNQFGQGRDLVELTGSILQILPKRDA